MVFSSVIFLFFFLPLALAIYFLVPARARNPVLLASSIVFYFWGESWHVFMLLGSIGGNYLFAELIARAKDGRPDGMPPKMARLWLFSAVLLNLGLLSYYKYANFFVKDILAGSMGLNTTLTTGWAEIALPLGISFFTFQAMSYVIDVYRGDVAKARSFTDFACYVSMFPQLVAGPIVRYKDISNQLRQRTITSDLFASGVRRFIVGLSKKVLIANPVAKTSDLIFSLPAAQLEMPHVWLGVACYTIQIYFDFSGYSDMAIGLGRMMGFNFAENFNFPYISRSIREFWQRWHISLSTWFRDYLYIPLGGNRVSSFRNYLNLWIVFILCGFWHGATFNFVLWGAYHGLFLVLERGKIGGLLARLPAPLQHAYTMGIVVVGWVIFRANDLAQAKDMLSVMFGIKPGGGIVYPVACFMGNDVLAALALGIVFSAPLSSMLGLRRRLTAWKVFEPLQAVSIAVLLLLCLASVSSNTYNPFIYFRF